MADIMVIRDGDRRPIFDNVAELHAPHDPACRVLGVIIMLVSCKEEKVRINRSQTLNHRISIHTILRRVTRKTRHDNAVFVRGCLTDQSLKHGFLTMEPDTEVQYKVDNPYAPECDGAVCWDDPELAIDWPVNTPPVLSAKDAEAPRFSGWQSPFEFGDPA